MAEFLIPEHPLLSDDERMELQEVFTRFAAALESPNAGSIETFRVEQKSYFDNASPIQAMIFALTMNQLGLISDDEVTTTLSSANLDEYIDVDELELSDLGIEVSDEGLTEALLLSSDD